MDRLMRVASGIWEFLVGDDWRLAAGSVTAVAAAAALGELGLNAWWLMAIAAPVVLFVSLRHR